MLRCILVFSMKLHFLFGNPGLTYHANCLTVGGNLIPRHVRLQRRKSIDARSFVRLPAIYGATTLHLWIPPNPSDTGASMGAAYQFAMLHDAPLGPKMENAFICGTPFSSENIRSEIVRSDEIQFRELGNITTQSDLDDIADRMAYIIEHNGVIGIFQGNSETGPRALGHRTILANPCNKSTLEVLNTLVKYRERIRPLAPMITLEHAGKYFHLSAGASDDNYNAYNYMVLTVEAKPEAYDIIPAVIHKDGTSRIQIVRKDSDVLSWSILKALGRRIHVEAAVNTSLNVGTPIVQTPEQAIHALKRSKGLTAVILVGEEGAVFIAWHDIDQAPKDKGAQLQRWLDEWEAG
jgi:carbamoyltransferase